MFGIPEDYSAGTAQSPKQASNARIQNKRKIQDAKYDSPIRRHFARCLYLKLQELRKLSGLTFQTHHEAHRISTKPPLWPRKVNATELELAQRKRQVLEKPLFPRLSFTA